MKASDSASSFPKSYLKGYRYSAVKSGIKKTGDLDLALIVSDEPASVAGVFTKNRFPAAPVILDRERIKDGRARAILANAGCANACTGEPGIEDAASSSRWIAVALDIPEEEILVASTGVIGDRLPVEKIRSNVSVLVAGLDAGASDKVARAIMTTDTVPKTAARSGAASGFPYGVFGVVKGSGMIHPDMATMLCFVMTDAKVEPAALRAALESGLERSFHAITVDGDTSTNDTVLVLANGASGGPVVVEGGPDFDVFANALGEVLEELAVAVVKDAEGATKLIHIRVEGAENKEAALLTAKAVAHSPLCKTAFYGEDINWGRILCAAGYGGAEVDPDKAALWYDDVQIVVNGRGVGPEAEARALLAAKNREFTVRLDLGVGDAEAVFHTSDLSHDYVTINASYKT